MNSQKTQNQPLLTNPSPFLSPTPYPSCHSLKILKIEKVKIQQKLKSHVIFLCNIVFLLLLLLLLFLVIKLKFKGPRVKTGSPNPFPPALVCLNASFIYHNIMNYNYSISDIQYYMHYCHLKSRRNTYLIFNFVQCESILFCEI